MKMDTLQFFPLSTADVWLARQWASCELCYGDATVPVTYPGPQSCVYKEQKKPVHSYRVMMPRL